MFRSLKRNIYQNLYMDNAAVLHSDASFIRCAYSQLEKIFSPYKFFVAAVYD